MSTTIDEKVVSMKFDNRQFESGVKTSMKTLDKLKEALNFENVVKGVEKINDALQNIKIQPALNAVDAISLKFNSLQVVAATVIGNITNTVVSGITGLFKNSLINKFFNQAATGGSARALKIADAKFQIEGLGYTYQSVYDQIDRAVTGTAYGFDAAAKAASQLLASNVEVGNSVKVFTNLTKTATEEMDSMEIALKSIAGVAAMTNSDYESMADIFTTVAGNGRLMTDQLNRLSARGLNAAASLGKALGKTEAEIREMTTKGQISFKMFSEAMYTAFAEHAADADNTFTGALANMKAAISRIGQPFAEAIYDGAIKPLNALKGLIKQLKTNLKPFEEQFKNLAKTASAFAYNVINGFKNFITPTVYNGSFFEKISNDATKNSANLKDALQEVINVLQTLMVNAAKIGYAIRLAFEEMFPKDNFQNVKKVAKDFGTLSDTLAITNDSLLFIKNTAAGVFAVIKILSKITYNVMKILSPLIGVVKVLGKVLLGVLSTLGLISKGADKLVSTSDILTRILYGLVYALSSVVVFIGEAITKLIAVINKFNISSTVEKEVKDTEDALSGITNAFQGMSVLLNGILMFIEKGFMAFIGVIYLGAMKIKEALSVIVNYFDSLRNSGISVTAAVIGTAFHGLAKAIEKVKDVIKETSDTIKKSGIKESVEGITNSIKGVVIAVRDFVFGIPGALMRVINIVGDKIRWFCDIVVGFIKDIGLAKIAALAYMGAMSMLVYKIAGAVGAFTDMTNSISTFFKSLEGAISGISQLATKKTNPLYTFAESLLMIAAAFWILSTIPTEQLKSIEITLGIALGAVVVLDALLSMVALFRKKLDIVIEANFAATVRAFGMSLIYMAIAFTAVAYALNLIKDIPIDKLKQSFEQFGELIALFTLSEILFGIVTKGSGIKSALSILIFAASLLATAKALKHLSNASEEFITLIDPIKEQLKKASVTIIALGALFYIISKQAFAYKNMFIGLIGLSFIITAFDATLILLTFMSKKLGTIEWNEILKGLAQFAGIALAISGTGFILGKYLTLNPEVPLLKFSVAVLAMAGAAAVLTILASQITLLMELDPVHTVMGFAVIVSVFYVVAQSLNGVLIRTGAFKPILALSAFMIILTGSLIVLTLLKPSELIVPLVSMLSLLYLMGQVLKAVSTISVSANESKMKELTKQIALMTFTIGTLSATLIILSNSDYKKVAYAAGAISVVLLSLGQAFKSLNDLKFDKNALKTLVPFVVAIAAVGATLVLLQVYSDNEGTIIASAGAIVACLLALSYAFKNLSGMHSPRSEKILYSLIPAIYMLVTIAGALVALAYFKVNWETAAVATSMGLVLVSLVYAMKNVSAIDFNPAQMQRLIKNLVICLAAFSVAIIPIILLNQILKANDMDSTMAELSKLLFGIAGVMGIMAGLLKVLTMLTPDLMGTSIFIGLMGSVGLMLYVISGAMPAMESIEWETVKKALVSLTAIVALSMGTLFIMSKLPAIDMMSTLASSIAAFVILSTMILTLKSLSDVFAEFSSSNIDFNKINESIPILITIFASLAVMTSVLLAGGWQGALAAGGAMLGFAGFIYIMANSLGALGDAIEPLEKINWSSIMSNAVPAMMALAGSTAALSAAAVLGLIGGPSLMILAAGMAVMSIAGEPFNRVMDRFIPNLEKLHTIPIKEIGSDLLEFSKSASEASLNADGMYKLGMAVLVLSALSSLGGMAIQSYVEPLSSLSKINLTTFSESFDKTSTLMSNFSSYGGSLAASSIESAIGFTALSFACNKLSYGLDNLSESFGTFEGLDFVTVNEQFNAMNETMKMASSNAMMFVAQGFVAGLKKVVPILGATGIGVAKVFDGGMYNEMGIHSPAAIAIAAVAFVALGFLAGLSINRWKIEDAGKGTGAAYTDGLNESVSDGTEKAVKKTLNFFNDDSVKQNAEIVGENVGAAVSNGLGDSMNSAGKNAVGSLAEGAVEEGEAVSPSMSELGSALGGALGNGLLTVLQGTFATINNWMYKMYDSWYQGLSQTEGGAESLLGRFSKFMSDVHKENRDMYDSWGKDSLTNFTESFSKLKGSINLGNMFGEGLFNMDFKDMLDMDGLSEQISDAMSGVGDLTGGLGDLTSATDGLNKSLEETNDTVKTSISIFDEFSNTVTKSIDDIMHAMYSQLEGTTQWANGILALSARGASKELLQYLGNMGESGYEIVNALLQGTQEQLEMVNDMFTESLILPDAAKVNIKAAYALAGDEAAQAYLDGLGVNLYEIQNKAIYLANAAATAVNSALPIKNAVIASDEIKEMFNSIYDSVESSINIFDKFNASTKMNADDILENMQSNIKGITQWSKNLNNLAKRGISKGLLDELTKLGPAGYEKVSAFTEMTSKELKQANKLYAKSLKLPQKTSGEVMNAYAEVGDKSVAEFLAALGAKKGDYEDAGKKVAAAFKEGMFSLDEEMIDSTVSTTENVIQALTESLHNGLPEIISEAELIGTEMGTAMGKAMNGALGNTKLDGIKGVAESEKVKAYANAGPNNSYEAQKEWEKKNGSFLETWKRYLVLNMIDQEELNDKYEGNIEKYTEEVVNSKKEEENIRNNMLKALDTKIGLDRINNPNNYYEAKMRIVPVVDLSSNEVVRKNINDDFSNTQPIYPELFDKQMAERDRLIQSTLEFLNNPSNKASATLDFEKSNSIAKEQTELLKDISNKETTTVVNNNLSIFLDSEEITDKVVENIVDETNRTGKSPLVRGKTKLATAF